MRASLTYTGLLLVYCICVAGCGTPERKPIRITDHRGYLLSEAPEHFDLSAVRGRKIVLDPGHGGPWPGAVGPNAVREADVNLGVALHLWGLLTEAGAEVTLTRTADTAVSDAPAPPLKEDLQARAELANQIGPDLFVSIHHNADIIPDSRKNDLETYYRLGEAGPSLDVAQAVHRHLARNLGQRPNAVLPGNFHVIRETRAPAILGEASYVSAEANAEHLAFAAMQRLEAEAYFLGIVEYFSRGVPRIHAIEPGDGATIDRLKVVSAVIERDRGVPIDPATIALELDGRVVQPRYDPGTGVAVAPVPADLANGVHTLRVSARNVRGNASVPQTARFILSMPAAAVQLRAEPAELHPASDRGAVVIAQVTDARGEPVADGTAVEFATTRGDLFRTSATTVQGEARTYWRAAGEVQEADIAAAVGGHMANRTILIEADAAKSRLVQVVRADGKGPVGGAQVFRAGGETDVGLTDPDGVTVAFGEEGQPITVRARGFWPNQVDLTYASVDAAQPVPLTPVVDGVLLNRVIAIDPADGGAEPGARGPTGVRAADLNLRIARYLADYIRQAGGEAVLTRSGDETTTAFTRVERSERATAERFVSIRQGSPSTPERVLDDTGHAATEAFRHGIVIEHYPTSLGGKRLAALLAKRLPWAVTDEEPRIVQSVAYELTHTACPAVRVQAMTPMSPETELALAEPSVQRRIAYALFLALAEDFGADARTLGGVDGRLVDGQGRPWSGATVTVNDVWLAITGRDGEFAFDLLPAGEVRLAIDCAGGRWSETVRVQAGQRRSLVLRSPTTAAPAGR